MLLLKRKSVISSRLLVTFIALLGLVLMLPSVAYATGGVPITTPFGPNVNINLGNGICLNFSNVTSGGTSTVITINNLPAALPSNLTAIGNYLDITTHAAFSGTITVTIPYDPNQVTGNPANLKLYHWNGSNWENATVSIDTVNHTITGSVTSLSPFAVVYPSGGAVPASSTWGLALMGLVGIVMLGRGLKRSEA